MISRMELKEFIKYKIHFSTVMIALSVIFSFVTWYKYGGGISSILLFIVLFVISAFYKISTSNLNMDECGIIILLILLWFAVTFSSLLSPFENSNQTLITFLIAVIYLILVMCNSLNEREVAFLLWSYILVVACGGCNIIFNALTGNEFAWHRFSTTFFGMQRDCNYVSAFMQGAVFLLYYNILHSKRRRLLKIMLTMVICSGITLTGSRMGMLQLVLTFGSITVLTVISKSKHKGKQLIFLFIIAAFLILFFRVLFGFFSKDLVARITTLDAYKDPYRVTLLETCFDVFKSYPIFGVGYNGLTAYLNSCGLLNSHNVYMDILAGNGIIGFLIFFTIIFLLIHNAKDRTYFLFFIVSMLGGLATINGYNTPSFWTPILLLTIVSMYSRRFGSKLYELL